MMEELDPRLVTLFRRLSRYLSLSAALAGLSVLAGWRFDNGLLKTLLPGLVPMTPGTALCFVTLGASVFLLNLPFRSRPEKASAALALGVWCWAFLALTQYSAGVDLGVDALFFGDKLSGIPGLYPGRMSPQSSICFLLLSASVMMFALYRSRVFSAYLYLFLQGGIALLGLIGYAYGVRALYAFSLYKPMALNTSAAMLLLFFSMLFLRPETGPMRITVAGTEGGRSMRRLIPVVLLAPFVFGWMIAQGCESHLYQVPVGLSILVVLVTVVFSGMIWKNALSLHRADILHKNAEHELYESEERYRQLIQNLPVGLFRSTPGEDGKFIMANPAMARMFGYDSMLDLAQTSFERVYGDAGRGSRFTSRFRARGNVIGEEMVFLRKDGSTFWGAVTAKVVKSAAGTVMFYDGMIEDVTERKRIEEMKSDFVSMVSHQLKTPVAQVKGYIYNMLAGITGELNPRQRQYLEDMQEVSRRNYDLISDLLNLSRLERGVINIQLQPVELKDIVDSTLNDYYESVRNKGLALSTEGLDEGIVVMADREKFSEALANVVNNALKFTESGSITVRARCGADYGVLEVEDTGPGIPAETMERLFRKDVALSGAPKAGSGVGLGLYIGKNFMSLQKGDLTVDSVIGKGTKFTFKIPLAQV